MRPLLPWIGLAISLAGAARAQEPAPPVATRSEIGGRRPFGLGASVGDPTALSAKLYLERRHAVDMALAFGPNGDDIGVYAHAVYLFHPSHLTEAQSLDLGWHVGIGGVIDDGARYGWRLDPGDELGIGVRTPIGLDLDLKDVPLQVFGDVAVDTFVLPVTTVDLGAALGVRYYF